MSNQYQKIMQPHFFYENPEYFDEAESFIDNVSFSESDGFIGFPMVRSVPSYDIQELYIKKPVNTSSQIIAVPQRSRRYIYGQRDFYPEYIYDLQPRPPPHLKSQHQANPIKSFLRLPQKSSSVNAQRSNCVGEVPRSFKAEKKGIIFKSSPSISLRSKFPDSEENIEECTRYNHRRNGRPSAPTPTRNLSCVSDLITNHQDRNLQDSSYRSQCLQEFYRSQEMESLQDYPPKTYKCRSYHDVHSEEEMKKPNSEGDATGYTGMNKLDNIGRIAATLDVNEAAKLSDKQREDIKKMSKFLIPRVPSSVRSLQEPTKTNQSDKIKKGIDENSEKNKNEFRLSFRKSLDSVLDQLESCEMSLNAVKSKFSIDNTFEKMPVTKNESKDDIFNLTEIYSKLNKTHAQNNIQNEDDSGTPDIILNEDNVNLEQKSQLCDGKSTSEKTVDETAVLDLHRSKSYIVNLIDRALSKELGTFTNESRHSFQDLDPVEVIKRIEMNRRMDSFVIAGKSTINQECKPSSAYAKDEEHKYIEQLRELRWGHFKHIQQEVKRLEDLEKFLDQCGTSNKSSL